MRSQLPMLIAAIGLIASASAEAATPATTTVSPPKAEQPTETAV